MGGGGRGAVVEDELERQHPAIAAEHALGERQRRSGPEAAREAIDDEVTRLQAAR